MGQVAVVATVHGIPDPLSLMSVHQPEDRVADRLVEIVREEYAPRVGEQVSLAESVILEAHLVLLHLAPSEQPRVGQRRHPFGQRLARAVRVKPEAGAGASSAKYVYSVCGMRVCLIGMQSTTNSCPWSTSTAAPWASSPL